jgi:hypothetical protein
VPGNVLDAAASAALFERRASITKIEVDIPESVITVT